MTARRARRARWAFDLETTMLARTPLLAGFALTLTACATAPAVLDVPDPEPVVVTPAPVEAAATDVPERPPTAEERRKAAKAEEAITVTRSLIDRAGEAAVDTFAPGLFTLAEAAWSAANAAFEDGDHAAAIEKSVKARDTLEEARAQAAPRLRMHALERFEADRINALMQRLVRLAVPIYTDDEVFVSLPDVFWPDSDRIRASARDELYKLAKVMKAHPTFIAVIEARADADLQATRRMNLSTSRALAVRAALADLGVPPERLRSMGRGKATPPLPGEPALPARLDVRFQPKPVKVVDADG